MAENTVSALAPFGNGYELDFIEKNGEILFTAEEIGRNLGYPHPNDSINTLFRRNQSELKHYSITIKTIAIDGKSRETRAFTEEGVYIISLLARTNQAKNFRARVALLLRRIRKEQTEHLATIAHESGYQQGLSEARALPALEAERKAGYLAGMKEGQKYRQGRDKLALLTRALDYRKKGLRQYEIARLLSLPSQRVSDLFASARKMGVLA